PIADMVAAAADTGTDRIELYTEAYAKEFHHNRDEAIASYIQAAVVAHEKKLGINAGHDLDMNNLAFFASSIPGLLEVSIGHALIADALYYGLENTIQLYKRRLVHSR
ncbi:MAG: pyridoxine 5'-phosphate synthase, partial [Taibaiella sp.]|nr:pyridoxine 5'-phosphate synthase [Taibaiella sp.]